MFILSKIIGYLLNPALWILVVLFIAWRTRNPYRRRRFLGLGIVLFLIFSNPYLIKRLIQSYQTPPMPMKVGERYDAGILLGGMMSYDEPSAKAYFNASSDRFIQTLLLYKQGYIRKIIVTGGNADLSPGAYREADWLVANFRSMDVPAEDILVERQARNTVENARFVHRITDSLQVQTPLVVVTSAWHMPRSIEIFKKEGIPIRPYPGDFLVVPYSPEYTPYSFIPNGNAFGNWTIYLKEWVGRLAMNLQRS